MANFKIVTTGPGGTDHSLEMEALSSLGAQIVEVGGGEDELVAAVADADAIYGKGRPRITAKVIGAGKKLCGPFAWRDRPDFTCFQNGSETAAISRGVQAELGNLTNTQGKVEVGPWVVQPAAPRR